MKHPGSLFFFALLTLCLGPTTGTAQMQPAATLVGSLEGGDDRRIDPALGREVVGIFGMGSDSKARADWLARLLEATWEDANGRRTLKRSPEQRRAVKTRDNQIQIGAFQAWQKRQTGTLPKQPQPAERVRILQGAFETAFQARRDPKKSETAMEDLRRLGGAQAFLRGVLISMSPEEAVRAAQSAPTYLSDRPGAGEKPLPAAATRLAGEYQEYRDAVRSTTESISGNDVSRVQYWREIFGTSTAALGYGKTIVTFRPIGRRMFAHLGTYSNTGAFLEQAAEIIDLEGGKVTVSPESEALLKRLGEEAIPLSTEAKTFLSGNRATNAAEAAAYVRAFQTAEPLGLGFDGLLETASRKWGKPVAARLPDTALSVLARAAGQGTVQAAYVLRSLVSDGSLEIEEMADVILIRPRNAAAAEFSRLDRKAARAFVGSWAKRSFDLWGLASYHAEAGWGASASLSESLKRGLQIAHSVRVSHSLPHFGLAFIGRLSPGAYQNMLAGRGLGGNTMSPEQRGLLWAWAALRGERDGPSAARLPDLVLNAPELIPNGISPRVQATFRTDNLSVIQIAPESRSDKLSGFPNIPTDARSVAQTIVGSFGAEAADDPLAFLDGMYLEGERQTIALVVRLAEGVILQGSYENPTRFATSAPRRKANELSARFRQELASMAKSMIRD